MARRIEALRSHDDFKHLYLPKAGIGAVPLPATVQAVLAASIDRLVEPSRQILQTASVIGREVSFVILESVTSLPADQISEALWPLLRAELRVYHLPNQARAPFGIC
jgi:predicted ATPase